MTERLLKEIDSLAIRIATGRASTKERQRHAHLLRRRDTEGLPKARRDELRAKE